MAVLPALVVTPAARESHSNSLSKSFSSITPVILRLFWKLENGYGEGLAEVMEALTKNSHSSAAICRTGKTQSYQNIGSVCFKDNVSKLLVLSRCFMPLVNVMS